MTLRHSVQHAVEGLADRITRVRYEIPPDCTFRAVVTGAADPVSISNIAAQTDGDETIFPLPSGSGSFEIEITSNGTDTNGYIQLEMSTPSGDAYLFDGQAFETISSIFEKKTQLALADQAVRTPFRLHPALSGFTAVWEMDSTTEQGPKIFPAETGGTSSAAITNAFEIWASSGTYSGDNYKISATLEGYGIAEEARFRVFIMVFEPITSATNDLGKTVNPSCVVVGRSGYFKARVSGNIDDDELVWSASSEEAGLVTSTGRMAEVVPTECGAYSLTLRIGDYECARGYIQFLAVEETTTEIRAYILGTADGFSRTAADVTNHVAIANKIYEQVGMKFTLHSVTNITLTPKKLQIDNPEGGLSRKEICDIATGTGGLEVYYIPSIDTNGTVAIDYLYDQRRLGIIASAQATGVTIAHEIGHACGLRDIYHGYPEIPLHVPPTFVQENLPGDRGSTSQNVSFYNMTNQLVVIDHLLMMGEESRMGTDIPLGHVFGLWFTWVNGRKSFQMSLAPVGVTPEFNRHPYHE